MEPTELYLATDAQVADYLFFICRSRPSPDRRHTYIGRRDSSGAVDSVRRDGQALDARLTKCKHSPTGFEWGYHGSGPAQLAYCILAAEVGNSLAEALYQSFKAGVVSGFPQDGGFRIISQDVLNWLWVHAERLAENDSDEL